MRWRTRSDEDEDRSLHKKGIRQSQCQGREKVSAGKKLETKQEKNLEAEMVKNALLSVGPQAPRDAPCMRQTERVRDKFVFDARDESQ